MRENHTFLPNPYYKMRIAKYITRSRARPFLKISLLKKNTENLT